MSKHEVLTGVSGIGKSKKRLVAGDVLDSTQVTDEELEFFLARGAVGPAKSKATVKSSNDLTVRADDEEGDD